MAMRAHRALTPENEDTIGNHVNPVKGCLSNLRALRGAKADFLVENEARKDGQQTLVPTYPISLPSLFPLGGPDMVGAGSREMLGLKPF